MVYSWALFETISVEIQRDVERIQLDVFSSPLPQIACTVDPDRWLIIPSGARNEADEGMNFAFSTF